MNISSFEIDSITASNSVVVDHDPLSGDDNAGIAVTDSFVYCVGNSYTVRYDLDLTSGVSLPIRDGIFSDLQTGALYTLRDGTTDPSYNLWNFPLSR